MCLVMKAYITQVFNMAYLEVLAGENAGQCIDLTQGIRIGRHVDNDLCLPSASTSRYHARIVRDGPRYLLEDLNSHNGTELCGLRIPPDTSFELTSGDVITIGASRLCFYESKEAVQREHLLPTPCEQPIAEPPAVAQDTSPSSSHTRMLQLTDEALACPLTIITRDASLDLHQIITHQPHTPQEIQQIYRRLQAICQINATLGTTTDFPAMTAILLDCLLEIYPKAERVLSFYPIPSKPSSFRLPQKYGTKHRCNPTSRYYPIPSSIR
jgi:hypothetical protein